MEIPIDMQTKLKARISKEEGMRQFPYRDSRGILSIGKGRNLETVGISVDEADVLLTNDLEHAEKTLDKLFAFYPKLSDVRKCVMLDMCFNMGIGKLLNLKKLLDYLNAEMYEFASAEMLDSLWAKQVGPRAKDLASMMSTDLWIE